MACHQCVDSEVAALRARIAELEAALRTVAEALLRGGVVSRAKKRRARK